MVVFDKLLLLLLLPSSMPGRPKWLWQCVPCTAEKTFQTNIHIPPSKPLCSSKLYFHSLLLAFSLLPCLVARENSTANGGVDVFQAANDTQQHTAASSKQQQQAATSSQQQSAEIRKSADHKQLLSQSHIALTLPVASEHTSRRLHTTCSAVSAPGSALCKKEHFWAETTIVN